MSVRVRYAPSPTGLQHIGSVRTALFNYLYARATGGAFVLRIEDTDRERFSPEALDDIHATFDWLGLSWDEGPGVGGPYGPYFQSQRAELYRAHAESLVGSGHAYRCYCTSERLAELREQQAQKKGEQGYDRRCRTLSDDERTRLEDSGAPSVIRFRVPLEGSSVFEDTILGAVKRKNRDINPDPVLLKSDGFPTYHLANVVDDHLMEITHILRAQEWVPSASLHVLLYDAFGWSPPVFCHLPMVMGKDGKKLSKRHGSTSVVDFRRAGYLNDAVVNYIALLGWAFDDKTEFFTRDELETKFSIERLNKSPAVFDYKKLEWFNGAYIRALSDAELINKIIPFLENAGLVTNPPSAEHCEILDGVAPLVKERLKLLSDAPEALRFLLSEIDPPTLEDLVPKKAGPKDALVALQEVEKLLDGFFDRTDEQNEEMFREASERLEMKLGHLLMPVRIAVTGSSVSPPLFGSIQLLGETKTRVRISEAIERLKEAIE
ncbi:MAG: glutamate--tRNA ligase [Spirochaetaceae bacterium]|nr:MAG: glutamate--tRNA ligase [Spirochaetaceae bacterium]